MKHGLYLLVGLAVLSTACPAQASVILGFAQSTFMGPASAPIPDNDPLGVPISMLTMGVNTQTYVQVTISATSPTLGWMDQPTSARLSAFGVVFNYPMPLVMQPFVNPGPMIDQNLPNCNVSAPYAVGHPNTFVGYNAGKTAFTGTTLTTSGAYGPPGGVGGPFLLATLRVVAGSSPGMGTLSLTDIDTAPQATTTGLFNGTTLDAEIFSRQYTIPINVVLPEPASMTLAGLAIAGLGWRRLRRRAG